MWEKFNQIVKKNVVLLTHFTLDWLIGWLIDWSSRWIYSAVHKHSSHSGCWIINVLQNSPSVQPGTSGPFGWLRPFWTLAENLPPQRPSNAHRELLVAVPLVSAGQSLCRSPPRSVPWQDGEGAPPEPEETRPLRSPEGQARMGVEPIFCSRRIYGFRATVCWKGKLIFISVLFLLLFFCFFFSLFFILLSVASSIFKHGLQFMVFYVLVW